MVTGTGGVGLERSCEAPRRDWIRSHEPSDGVQLLQAWFGGRAFDKHRHDTYAIGLTDTGVQDFDYRGVTQHSTPGKVVVLHPDETHDGRAGSRDGFGYRIVYVAPARIRDAARAIHGRPCALPFMREPVTRNVRLACAIDAAFRHGTEPLAIDALVVQFTRALLEGDPSCGSVTPTTHIDGDALRRARDFLDAETSRVVRSSELEAITGLTRYDLTRQFHTAFGTSPYRYSLMRRLARALVQLREDDSLADVALATGFADQPHLTRMFKAAFGLTPAQYRGLLEGK